MTPSRSVKVSETEKMEDNLKECRPAMCEGLTVVMLVVGVGCAKVVVTIPCLVC